MVRVDSQEVISVNKLHPMSKTSHQATVILQHCIVYPDCNFFQRWLALLDVISVHRNANKKGTWKMSNSPDQTRLSIINLWRVSKVISEAFMGFNNFSGEQPPKHENLAGSTDSGWRSYSDRVLLSPARLGCSKRSENKPGLLWNLILCLKA